MTKSTCEITQHAKSLCIGYRRAAIFLSYLPCKHTQSIMTHAVVGRGGFSVQRLLVFCTHGSKFILDVFQCSLLDVAFRM